MNLRRSLPLALVAVILSTAILMFPHVASAHAASTSQATKAAAACIDDACDGKSPVTTGCQNDAITERTAVNNTATIHLNFSPSCHAAWGKIEFSSPVPSGDTADVEVGRSTDQKTYLCESAGGNGIVLAGQTACYTPMLGDGPSESTAAVGWFTTKALGRYEIAATTLF